MQALRVESSPVQRFPLNELVLSFLAITGITAVYLLVVLSVGLPAASGFFGHSIGILGFMLMLSTETLYSLRKRIGSSAWGRPSSWLKFHIFTGIVGPYLVFLHSAWDFGGLAGLTMLLTAIVVLSGFIGRYIYALLPRTAEGVVLEESEIRARIRAAEQDLQKYLQFHGSEGDPIFVKEQTGSSPIKSITAADPSGLFSGQLAGFWFRRAKRSEIKRLRRRQRKLERQVKSLATARRLFALWHTFHIPLGMAMFAMAFTHIAAALYYATLLR
jgi:hypothetical protein